MIYDDLRRVDSNVSTTVIVDGYRFAINIFCLRPEKTWTLEVVDGNNTSHVWEEQFPTEEDALDTAIKAVETKDGLAIVQADSAISVLSE